MISESIINECKSKLPDWFSKYFKDFVFIDFEVFKHDWLICFSVDGIHVKSIVNDSEKLKNLFLNKLNDRIIIAYNGNGYDKFIALGLFNNINAKEINDNIIHNFNFNFFQTYGPDIVLGKELMWYDPTGRGTGSLKTYEACEGEDIYESNVDFDLDRKLTSEEIAETIKYCSFDVTMLIKYFYMVDFDSFLGHIGLVKQTIDARPFIDFNKALSKTDASLVGTYLCSGPTVDTTKKTDTIKLPNNIYLGKYKDQIEEFLKIPIYTLKNGSYTDLNSWSLKVIEKSINKAVDTTNLDKLKNKEKKSLDKIKKIKIEMQTLKNKNKLTVNQSKKLQEAPEKINKEKEILKSIRQNISNENEYLNELQTILNELNKYDKNLSDSKYANILSKLIEKANVTDNSKKLILCNYLNQSDDQFFDIRYIQNKKDTIYNSILKEYPFEVILNIKNVPHAFKTGGIHSIFGKPMTFDKNTEHDKNRRLLIADVGSLYPNLMRVFGLCSIGMDDPAMFSQMIFDRIKLKKIGDPFAGVLKLILNTTYGCMGSVHNFLYDPTNRLKVCIFGQCAIVDLLDKLEDKISGLEIFQSNTDGIIISCEDYEYDCVVEIIHEWENRTGLEMEIDECKALFQKDVSNYILIEN